MHALKLLVMPLMLIVAKPDRPVPVQPTGWVGKTVFVKKIGVKFHRLDDSGVPVDLGLLTGIDYKVLGDNKAQVQIKTRQGLLGWVEKSDVVLLEDAVLFYTNRIQQNGNDHDAYNRRACAWKMKGEYDIAIKDFDEALRINPDPALYNNRASAYQAKKDYDKAIEDYSEAIRVNPNFAIAYFNRAVLWQNKRQYDKAIDDYTVAIKLDNKVVGAFRNRGVMHHLKKEHDQAIEDFTEALRLDPREVIVLTDRGNSFAEKKQYDKAIADYTEAIRLNAKFGLAYSGRGATHIRAKDYEKGLADYNEAMKLDPKNANVFNLVAWHLATCPDAKGRDGKRAVELAKQALLLAKTASIMDTLAAAYAEAGDFDEAIRAQEQALMDPVFGTDQGGRDRLELYKKKQAYRQSD